jgi:hypothetical protein
MTKWLFYRVPTHLKFAYVIGLVFSMLIIPEYVLSIRLNNLGEFMNFLVFDLTFYLIASNIDIENF